MNRPRPFEVQPWMLFALPLGIAVPIVGGFLLGGPAAGFVVALLVAATIVVVAIRTPSRAPGATARARDTGWRRAAARRFAVPVIVAAAGIALVVLASGTARAVGWGVVAIAITVAMSLVFLEIGYSEDRARARERRQPPRDRPD
jgi:hypothetical protein